MTRQTPFRRNEHKSGFTLIELLVVSAVIVTLMAILLPAIQKVREAANSMRCASNLKQIGIAMHNYHEALGHFPPGYNSYFDSTNGKETGPGWGWGAHLLPFIEADNVHRIIDFKSAMADPVNALVRTQKIKIYLCPSDGEVDLILVHDEAGSVLFTAGPSNYVAVYGHGEIDGPGNGCFFVNSKITIDDIKDGTSNTLFVGERSRTRLADATWSGAPTGAYLSPNIAGVEVGEGPAAFVLGHSGEEDTIHTPNFFPPHAADFVSAHVGGCNFLFGDGAVRFLRGDINPFTYQGLMTRKGRENINFGDF